MAGFVWTRTRPVRLVARQAWFVRIRHGVRHPMARFVCAGHAAGFVRTRARAWLIRIATV